MKVSWEYDGKQSKTRVVVRDDSKICSECSGYDGHFNECSKLEEIKRKEREEEQVRLLKKSLEEIKN